MSAGTRSRDATCSSLCCRTDGPHRGSVWQRPESWARQLSGTVSNVWRANCSDEASCQPASISSSYLGETCSMHPSPVLNPTTTQFSSDGTSETAGHVSLAAGLMLAGIRAYKLTLSPHFSGCCRYEPSCSSYMAEAVGRHGAARGLALGLRRLARCHPFGRHGFDPVPPD